MNKRAVIYGRVSTNRQDFERQIKDLEKYAKVYDYKIIRIFTEKVSGTTKAQNRKAAKEFLDYIVTNKIDIVLVSEISRLGRSAIDVQKTIDGIVNERKINLYIDQQGLTAYQKNGKVNPTFKLITDVLANVAEMERDTIVFRIKSGLENAKRKGKTLGRPEGSSKTPEQFLSENKRVVKELEKGTSIRNTAKICEVSTFTVQKVKKMLNQHAVA